MDMRGMGAGLKRAALRFVHEQRGDQNVGNLGLIVVAVAIIGVLMTKFVPGVESIVDGVIDKLKSALGV